MAQARGSSNARNNTNYEGINEKIRKEVKEAEIRLLDLLIKRIDERIKKTNKNWVAILISIISVLITAVMAYFAFTSSTAAKQSAKAATTAVSYSDIDRLKARTPRYIIKDLILDEEYLSNPLEFIHTQFDFEKMSIALGRTTLKRKNSNAKQTEYVIVLNTANNTDPAIRVDNYGYIVLTNTNAYASRIEITSVDVHLINGDIVTLEANSNHHYIEPKGETTLFLYISMRSDRNRSMLIDDIILNQNYHNKYSLTDNGSTRGLKLETGADQYIKLVFHLVTTNQEGEQFSQVLEAEIKDSQFLFPDTSYPEQIETSKSTQTVIIDLSA